MNWKTTPVEGKGSLYSVTNLSQASDESILNKSNIW